MTFIEKYNKIMAENALRAHAIQQHVVRTYKEILNSVGAYTDEKLGKDNIPLNGLVNRPEGGETKPVKDEDKLPPLPATKREAVAKQIYDEFKQDGINKAYRQNLLDDGYKIFVEIVDELKLWREFPPTS